MSDFFLFHEGPKGRFISVDANGRIVANSDPSAAPYVYTYGNTGRTLSVDASGRLMVNMGLIANGFSTLASASGIVPDFTNYNNFYLPIEHDVTLSPPVPGSDGAKYFIAIKQVASGGGKSITVNNTVWAGGITPTLTAASGSKDAISLTYIAALGEYWGVFQDNWS